LYQQGDNEQAKWRVIQKHSTQRHQTNQLKLLIGNYGEWSKFYRKDNMEK
jgi:hypothetical protein